MDLPEVYDTLPAFDLDADRPWDRPDDSATAIYGLFTPDGRHLRYIGKTEQPAERYNHHCALRAKDWSRKTGWLLGLRDCARRPVFRVLAWVPTPQWPMVERSFIAQARHEGCLLLNETVGGLGCDGYEVSAGGRYKRALAALGNSHGSDYWTPERRAERSAHYLERRDQIAEKTRRAMARPDTKQRMIEGLKRAWTPERRRAHAEQCRGLKASEETRAKMSAAHKGSKHSEETRDAMRARWADPEYRAMMLAARAAARAKRGGTGTCP